MAITVPASDAQGTALQATITAIVAQQSTAPFNIAGGSFTLDAARRLDQAQHELCLYLLAYRKVKPSSMLANETYGV